MSSKPRLLSSLHLLGAAAFADVPNGGGLVVEFAEGCDVVAEVLRGGGDGQLLIKALMVGGHLVGAGEVHVWALCVCVCVG